LTKLRCTRLRALPCMPVEPALCRMSRVVPVGSVMVRHAVLPGLVRALRMAVAWVGGRLTEKT